MRGPWPSLLAGMALAALVGWVSVCVDVVAHPELDETEVVDAAYLIGPAETRIEETLALVDTGVAPLLMATTSVNAETDESYATGHCGLQAGGYRVECVVPEPYSTRGEARLLGREAEEQQWERVAVVTSRPHAARTRLLMERCADAEVLVWAVGREPGSWRGWALSSVYESAAWVKTQVVRDC
ncbi:hypothetical protein [Ornithinimicrobium tianjinense]|uniref:hypothetical protein n=1 Tax=Ornithinimicrobium tianjinense TaxID=1195761 RepID=UPI001668B5DC|nr:hypothetical protein [Ornithinimicrobium tianjinense]